MTIEKLQELACQFGLKASSRTQIIRHIQLLRGGEPCFSSEKRYGCAESCEWSPDCRKLRAQWKF